MCWFYQHLNVLCWISPPHQLIILTLHTVQGLGGKEGEHSTAIAKQHKDENRFGNILVCKFLRIFYTKFLLWIHAHTCTSLVSCRWWQPHYPRPHPWTRGLSEWLHQCLLCRRECVCVIKGSRTIDGVWNYVANDRKESDTPMHVNSLRWLLSLPWKSMNNHVI